MKRVLGGLMVLMGVVLGCWVGYSLLVDRRPDAQITSLIPPILFCAGLLFVGVKWARE